MDGSPRVLCEGGVQHSPHSQRHPTIFSEGHGVSPTGNKEETNQDKIGAIIPCTANSDTFFQRVKTSHFWPFTYNCRVVPADWRGTQGLLPRELPCRPRPSLDRCNRGSPLSKSTAATSRLDSSPSCGIFPRSPDQLRTSTASAANTLSSCESQSKLATLCPDHAARLTLALIFSPPN